MEVTRGVQLAVVVAIVAGIGVGTAMLSRPSAEPVVPIELAVAEPLDRDDPSMPPSASPSDRTEDLDADSIVTPDVREDLPPADLDRDRQARPDGAIGETTRPAGGRSSTDDVGDDGDDGDDGANEADGEDDGQDADDDEVDGTDDDANEADDADDEDDEVDD